MVSCSISYSLLICKWVPSVLCCTTVLCVVLILIHPLPPLSHYIMANMSLAFALLVPLTRVPCVRKLVCRSQSSKRYNFITPWPHFSQSSNEAKVLCVWCLCRNGLASVDDIFQTTYGGKGRMPVSFLCSYLSPESFESILFSAQTCKISRCLSWLWTKLR